VAATSGIRKQLLLFVLLAAIVVAVVVLPRQSASFKALTEHIKADADVVRQVDGVSDITILKSRSVGSSSESAAYDWYSVRIEGKSGATDRRYRVEKQDGGWRVAPDS
jgi:hypothetical protein